MENKTSFFQRIFEGRTLDEIARIELLILIILLGLLLIKSLYFGGVE